MESIHGYRPPRIYLFLQGPPSGFWSRLARALTVDGHKVLKVNFSLADRLFWKLGNARTFRAPLKDWRTWLDELIEQECVTDILFYNDGFPYHEIAIKAARHSAVRAWCVEFGYLSPDWITLEPDGMNSSSRFPHQAEDIRRLGQFGSEPDLKLRYPHKFATEAMHEIFFNLAQSLGRPYNLHLRSGKNLAPALEYIGWIPKLLRAPRQRCRAKRLKRHIFVGGMRYVLVAMQMDGDYQVRSSRFSDMRTFLLEVIQSFSDHAPADLNLVIKGHPLESGYVNWGNHVRRIATSCGVKKRVLYTDHGDIVAYLQNSDGMVTINSTTGLHALQLLTPVMALGNPVYDRPGLTHQGSLELFWSHSDPIDEGFLHSFLRALSVIQVKGSFYNLGGQEYAIETIKKRLTDYGPNSIHVLLPD